MFGEFGDDQLSEQADPGNASAQGTRRGFGGDHAVAAARAGILGQYVDMKLEVGRDKLEHTGLILADACLGLAALRGCDRAGAKDYAAFLGFFSLELP